MPTATQRKAARRELVEHFVHLAENAGLDVAERFLSNAETSFSEIARQPRMGAPLKFKHQGNRHPPDERAGHTTRPGSAGLAFILFGAQRPAGLGCSCQTLPSP